MSKGVCHTKTCSQAMSGEPVDLYPGPGEFCPECGEPLEPVVLASDLLASALAQPRISAPGKSKRKSAAQPPVNLASPGQTAPEPAAKPVVRPQVPQKKATPPKPKGRGGIPAAALAFAGAALLFIMGALFLLRPSSSTAPSSTAVRVCATSITQRLAGDIVTAYEAKTDAPPSAFDVVGANGSQVLCDVRFMARAIKKPDWTVGHDAIVVVVNPANPINRITPDQVRGIFSGSLNNWSQLGGTPGPIVAKLPDETGDEAQLLSTTLLGGVKTSPDVARLPSSSDVVRAVSSASGRNMIGLVAFSQAVPGKVLALGDSPVPSTLTIADHSYPLSVTVLVTSDDNAPDAKAAGLIKYARSADVQSLVVHSGLVAKEGL
ncbi:MAG: substrate-binding domain-containing protein [Vulcanimicrobiaceae bacterium]